MIMTRVPPPLELAVPAGEGTAGAATARTGRDEALRREMEGAARLFAPSDDDDDALEARRAAKIDTM